MQFYRAFEDSPGYGVWKRIRGSVPYLKERLKKIQDQNQTCLYEHDVATIDFALEIANSDTNAESTYGIDTIESVYHDVLDMAKRHPMETVQTDEEFEGFDNVISEKDVKEAKDEPETKETKGPGEVVDIKNQSESGAATDVLDPMDVEEEKMNRSEQLLVKPFKAGVSPVPEETRFDESAWECDTKNFAIPTRFQGKPSRDCQREAFFQERSQNQLDPYHSDRVQNQPFEASDSRFRNTVSRDAQDDYPIEPFSPEQNQERGEWNNYRDARDRNHQSFDTRSNSSLNKMSLERGNDDEMEVQSQEQSEDLEEPKSSDDDYHEMTHDSNNCSPHKATSSPTLLDVQASSPSGASSAKSFESRLQSKIGYWNDEFVKLGIKDSPFEPAKSDSKSQPEELEGKVLAKMSGSGCKPRKKSVQPPIPSSTPTKNSKQPVKSPITRKKPNPKTRRPKPLSSNRTEESSPKKQRQGLTVKLPQPEELEGKVVAKMSGSGCKPRRKSVRPPIPSSTPTKNSKKPVKGPITRKKPNPKTRRPKPPPSSNKTDESSPPTKPRQGPTVKLPFPNSRKTSERKTRAKPIKYFSSSSESESKSESASGSSSDEGTVAVGMKTRQKSARGSLDPAICSLADIVVSITPGITLDEATKMMEKEKGREALVTLIKDFIQREEEQANSPGGNQTSMEHLNLLKRLLVKATDRFPAKTVGKRIKKVSHTDSAIASSSTGQRNEDEKMESATQKTTHEKEIITENVQSEPSNPNKPSTSTESPSKRNELEYVVPDAVLEMLRNSKAISFNPRPVRIDPDVGKVKLESGVKTEQEPIPEDSD